MKILIADDHALFRDGLSIHLKQIDSHVEVLHAGTFTHTFEILAKEKNINLTIIDLAMPDMGWEEGLKQLREKFPDARFVIVSASEDTHSMRKSLEFGASGYIPKTVNTKILMSALRLILDGGSYIPPALIERSKAPGFSRSIGGKRLLTGRQLQVLALVAEGKSNKQIAFELSVSEATIKLHINSILKTLGANNRTQALIIAQKQGLI